MQLDRSGGRRQFPALGQRSSLTSAGRMLADLLGPIRCLTSFLEDATNLLNGLLSQVPKALWRLVLGLFVPAHGCLPFWASRSIELPDRLQHGGSQPSDNRPVPPPLGVAEQTRFGLLCRGDAPSMTALQEGRRRGPNAEPPVRSFGNARTCAAAGHTSWSAAVIRRLRVGQFGNRDQYRLEATYYLTPLPVDGGAGLGRDGDQAPMAILHAGLPRRTGGCCYCWAGPGWWLPSRVRSGSGSDMAAVASGSSVPAVAAGSVRLVSRPGPGFSVSLPTMPVSAWPLEVVSWGAPARGRPTPAWWAARPRSGSAPDMPTVLVGCSLLVAAGSGVGLVGVATGPRVVSVAAEHAGIRWAVG